MACEYHTNQQTQQEQQRRDHMQPRTRKCMTETEHTHPTNRTMNIRKTIMQRQHKTNPAYAHGGHKETHRKKRRHTMFI